MLNKCCITVFKICATILLKHLVPLSIHSTNNLEKVIVLTHGVNICQQVHLKNSHSQTEHTFAQILIQIHSRTSKLCILTIIFEKNSITRQNIGRINSPLRKCCSLSRPSWKEFIPFSKVRSSNFFRINPSTIIQKLNTIEL